MSKYTTGAPQRESERPTERPQFCGVANCQSRWDPRDAKHLRGFADVVFTLDDGTVIARCGDCYIRHIYAAGKGVHCEITGRQPDMNIDMVKAHWSRVDAADAAKQAKAVRA
ncbi:hypothetical protein [Frateuria terrea]|uniref:Uncharacterized protein n=1 Tax=Frateuria terrea TaxID=529704 RepID=A0A1H7A0G2_9GAMM|nr:hypothetical protein [Frateuria terrea]SEJ55320.1 hypothetical protein SAMN04487997_0193 [Frateuria terrea]SFP47254.1 hypothetical protein SAMN02927913_2197 [Frateuria terrea]